MNAPQSFKRFVLNIDPMASLGHPIAVDLPTDREPTDDEIDKRERGLINFALDLVRPKSDLLSLKNYLIYVESQVVAPGALLLLWRNFGARYRVEPEIALRWFIQSVIKEIDHRLSAPR